ncbi:MAG: hypothetical protein II852_16595 [Bacteroidales bacterium]|nr:hypothetical protein [Bacteroidales bacterium]
MKSENTTFYNTDDNSEHILTVKRKKFPWWVLLFLLIPLFFVIKYQCANEVAVVPQADTTQKDTVANIVVQEPKIEEPKPIEEPKIEEPKKDDKQFQGEGGDLRINLQWYNESDLDLKVTDPCGQEIRYKKRTATCNGGTGKLDIDANADSDDEYSKTPQENIFFTNPAKGNYIIKVHCYEKREDKPVVDFNITIIDRNGNRKDFPGKVKQGETVTVTTWKEE